MHDWTDVWVSHDGAHWRACAEAIASSLRARGCGAVVIGPADFASWAVCVGDDGIVVTAAGRNMQAPKAILHLRSPVPQSPGLPVVAAQFVEAQWRTMFRGLLLSLEEQGVPVLNPTQATRWDEKTAQLAAARAVGLEIPATLQAAFSAPLKSFAELYGTAIAAKTFRPFRRPTSDRGFQWSPTRLVEANVMSRDLDGTDHPAPFVMQPFIEAAAEHRVFVTRDQVFGARVEREAETAVDVRHADVATMSLTSSSLPDELASQCVALARRCGLDYAVMDLLETDDGYVFLDLNPGGLFYWVEQRTGQSLTNALAETVVARAASVA